MPSASSGAMPFPLTSSLPITSRPIAPSIRSQLRERSMIWVSYAVQQTQTPVAALSVPSPSMSNLLSSMSAAQATPLSTSSVGGAAQQAFAAPKGTLSAGLITSQAVSELSEDEGEEDWDECEEDDDESGDDGANDAPDMPAPVAASTDVSQPTGGLLGVLNPLLDTASDLLRRDPNKWWTPSPTSDWSDWDTWTAAGPTDMATSYQDGRWTPSPTTPPIASLTNAQAALQIPSNLSLDPSQASLASAALAALTSLTALPTSGVVPLVARPLSARPSATAIVLPVVIAAVILLIALVMCLRGRSKSKGAADVEKDWRPAPPPVTLGPGGAAGLTPGVTVTRKDPTLNVEYSGGHGFTHSSLGRDPEKSGWHDDGHLGVTHDRVEPVNSLDRHDSTYHRHDGDTWDEPPRPVCRTPPAMTSLPSLHLGSSRCFSSDDYLCALPAARTASRASACSCPSCRPRSALTRLSTRCRSAFSRSDRSSLLPRQEEDCPGGNHCQCQPSHQISSRSMSSSRSSTTVRNPFDPPLDVCSMSSSRPSTRSSIRSSEARADVAAHPVYWREARLKRAGDYSSTRHAGPSRSPPLPPRPRSPPEYASSHDRPTFKPQSVDTYTTLRQPSTRTRKLQRIQEIDAERETLSREVQHLQSSASRSAYAPRETLHLPASMTRDEGISRATAISRGSGVSQGSRAEMGELYEALRVAIGEVSH